MNELVSQTVYFAESGPVNTERTLALVAERAKALGIQTVLVATTSGATGLQAVQTLSGLDVIAVTHSAGFREPYDVEHDRAVCERIEGAGGKVLTATHAFGGVGRAVRKKLDTYQIEEIIAFTLRLFGEGMKVAAEIALMASDAGLVPTAEPLIAVSGTGQGADTAVVLRPTHAQTFFDLRFLEIICMPAPGHPALA
ncbi:MAG: pyruvate kinase alpha/beta domain-containing protein [Anaerolineae bacterium]